MTRGGKSHIASTNFQTVRLSEKMVLSSWDPTCTTAHLCPTLANRWEGIFDEDTVLAALGKLKQRPNQESKNETGCKPEDKKIDFDNSDSDEDMFVPDELEMLSYNHGSELQDIEYRSDHRVEVNELFHTSAGIGTTWGKPNHSNLMAEQKKLEDDSENAKKIEEALEKERKAKKRKTARSKQHSKRIAWIKKNDNHDRVGAEGRCKYIELYSVFNDKQLFLNVQDSLSPLQIGYVLNLV